MWDLFCSVIDNYGDIGVAWRLARILDEEQGVLVRLWVDDLVSFGRIEQRLDPLAETQRVAGVEIRAWRTPFDPVEPGEAVIEAFGCTLPPVYVEAMAARRPAPVWINLEYLTAEDWAAGCHGLPSPHPRLPLVKHFFFPGFGRGTGGLLRERNLPAIRDGRESHRLARRLRVSVFSYDNPALPALLEAWANGGEPVECVVPEGRAVDGVRRFLGGRSVLPGERHERGSLAVEIAPWTDQPGYDRLLGSCDWNFVRGEDSFVRAQWAARPFVWHIYPQADSAHLNKLDAFLARYGADLAADTREALVGFTKWWNGAAPGDPMPWWRLLCRRHDALLAHARDWAAALAAGPELAAELAKFVRERLK